MNDYLLPNYDNIHTSGAVTAFGRGFFARQFLVSDLVGGAITLTILKNDGVRQWEG